MHANVLQHEINYTVDLLADLYKQLNICRRKNRMYYYKLIVNRGYIISYLADDYVDFSEVLLPDPITGVALYVNMSEFITYIKSVIETLVQGRNDNNHEFKVMKREMRRLGVNLNNLKMLLDTLH